VWQRVEPLLHPGVNEVREPGVSFDEGHGCLDGSLVPDPSQVIMRANSYWQDQVALLDASARSTSYQLQTGSRHEVR
jgi:hypothetical protein